MISSVVIRTSALFRSRSISRRRVRSGLRPGGSGRMFRRIRTAPRYAAAGGRPVRGCGPGWSPGPWPVMRIAGAFVEAGVLPLLLLHQEHSGLPIVSPDCHLISLCHFRDPRHCRDGQLVAREPSVHPEFSDCMASRLPVTRAKPSSTATAPSMTRPATGSRGSRSCACRHCRRDDRRTTRVLHSSTSSLILPPDPGSRASRSPAGRRLCRSCDRARFFPPHVANAATRRL